MRNVRRGSERGEEVQELLTGLRREIRVTVASVFCLPIVVPNGGVDRRGATVMQIGPTPAQAPERRGPHFGHPGIGLGNAVSECSHIVEEKVGVEEDLFGTQRSDGAGTGDHHRHMAVCAADLLEDVPAAV